MENIELWLRLIGKGLLSLLAHPFFYIAFLLLVIIYTYRTRMERAMFSVKLQTWIRPFIYSLLGGLILSIAITSVSILLGLSFTQDTVWWIWGITIIGMLLRIRFVNFAYAAGLISLLQLVANSVGPLPLQSDLLMIYESLLSVDAVHIVIVASLMSLGQSLLIKWQGKHFISPIYLAGKRGKVIGGYVLQGYWLAPILLFTPVTTDTSGASFSIGTLQPFFLTAGIDTWLLLACPLLLGATGVTYSNRPELFIKRMYKQQLLMSIVLLIISVGAWWFNPLVWVAALGLISSNELIQVINRWYESKQSPIYGPLDRGLRVLGIVEHSPAVHMGIQPGDTVLKANGIQVHSLEELYAAMATNPAFCKLELLNQEGEIKFAQRARFADEHHQLGIIMAPDKQSKYLEYYREPSLLSLFGAGKLRRQSSSTKDVKISL